MASLDIGLPAWKICEVPGRSYRGSGSAPANLKKLITINGTKWFLDQVLKRRLNQPRSEGEELVPGVFWFQTGHNMTVICGKVWLLLIYLRTATPRQAGTFTLKLNCNASLVKQ